jgi:hypothetical protein
LHAVVPASRLSVRPRPATVSTGIAELDALAGGLPRGAVTEVVGPASSGRSSVLLSVLAVATAREETCALVDTDDTFDPCSAEAAGVDLKRVLWVRCSGEKNTPAESDSREPQTPATKQRESRKREFRRIEQALRACDLLLQSGGFGIIAVDLADVPPRLARRIPLTSWFRFRRAVENTPAVLLVLEQEPFAKSCASLLVKLESSRVARNGIHLAHTHANASTLGRWDSAAEPAPHTNLLAGLNVHAEVVEDRTERKPVRSATTNFQAKASWAG